MNEMIVEAVICCLQQAQVSVLNEWMVAEIAEVK
jgi:hypothetical protein